MTAAALHRDLSLGLHSVCAFDNAQMKFSLTAGLLALTASSLSKTTPFEDLSLCSIIQTATAFSRAAADLEADPIALRSPDRTADLAFSLIS